VLQGTGTMEHGNLSLGSTDTGWDEDLEDGSTQHGGASHRGAGGSLTLTGESPDINDGAYAWGRGRARASPTPPPWCATGGHDQRGCQPDNTGIISVQGGVMILGEGDQQRHNLGPAGDLISAS
jgi:hypothetical protein